MKSKLFIVLCAIMPFNQALCSDSIIQTAIQSAMSAIKSTSQAITNSFTLENSTLVNVTQLAITTAMIYAGYKAKQALFPDKNIIDQRLLDAIEKNNLNEIKRLIDTGINVNAVDKHRYTALMYALIYGTINPATIDSIKVLLNSKKIDVHAINKQGDTTLILAAKLENAYTVEALLKIPEIKVNAIDASGCTALMHAVASGNVAIIELLLNDNRIDVNAIDADGWTALMHAVVSGNVAIIEELLDLAEIRVNVVDKNGYTALARAISYGDITTIKALLRDPRISDTDMRLLNFIVLYGNVDTIKTLLKFLQIDINAVDEHGNTALMGAVRSGNVALVEALLNAPGINVNADALVKYGYTALIIAARDGNLAIVKALLKDQRINVNAVACGDTALIMATHCGHAAIVEALLKVPGIKY